MTLPAALGKGGGGGLQRQKACGTEAAALAEDSQPVGQTRVERGVVGEERRLDGAPEGGARSHESGRRRLLDGVRGFSRRFRYRRRMQSSAGLESPSALAHKTPIPCSASCMARECSRWFPAIQPQKDRGSGYPPRAAHEEGQGRLQALSFFPAVVVQRLECCSGEERGRGRARSGGALFRGRSQGFFLGIGPAGGSVHAAGLQPLCGGGCSHGLTCELTAAGDFSASEELRRCQRRVSGLSPEQSRSRLYACPGHSCSGGCWRHGCEVQACCPEAGPRTRSRDGPRDHLFLPAEPQRHGRKRSPRSGG